MAIQNNKMITWGDLSGIILNSIKANCCNIDGISGNVPSRLRSGQGQIAVASVTTNKNNQGGKPTYAAPITHYYYANPGNLINVVAGESVTNEWNDYLSRCKIVNRTNKVIQACEIGLVIALYRKFMSFHLKPIYSKRQIYNTLETNPGDFQGYRYVTGTCPAPSNPSTGINPTNIPSVKDTDITNMLKENFNQNELYTNTPNFTTCVLS